VIKLEHANLSVTDVDATTRFITAALPELTVRGEGRDGAGRLWRHVGNQHFYVALQAVPDRGGREPYGNTGGLNHLGWEVEDVAQVEARLRSAGFTPNMHADDHPARRRVYFHDPDGNDWEFVEYLTDDPGARHSYDR
jgi:catechol 2,3-dioxygenase-like lactoylglutathione lyase family enzyme